MFDDAFRLVLSLRANGGFTPPNVYIEKCLTNLPETITGKINDAGKFIDEHTFIFRFGLCLYLTDTRLNIQDPVILQSVMGIMPCPDYRMYGDFSAEETKTLFNFYVAMMDAGFKRNHIREHGKFY